MHRPFIGVERDHLDLLRRQTRDRHDRHGRRDRPRTLQLTLQSKAPLRVAHRNMNILHEHHSSPTATPFPPNTPSNVDKARLTPHATATRTLTCPPSPFLPWALVAHLRGRESSDEPRVLVNERREDHEGFGMSRKRRLLASGPNQTAAVAPPSLPKERSRITVIRRRPHVSRDGGVGAGEATCMLQ